MSTRIQTGMGAQAAVLPAGVSLPTAPTPPAVIGRHHGEDPFAYKALRAHAVACLQALSAEHWTDFNYHDPGITLMEALCFALTEDVFTAEQPLVDQLMAPDGNLHYRQLGLQAAEAIFPCRPCTATDYSVWLLDRVPGALQARAVMPESNGLWRLELEAASAATAQAPAHAARAYWAQRNLGEDIVGVPGVLQPRWCNLNLDLSLEGAREPEAILAELIARCATHIDSAPRRESLRERMSGDDGERSLADAFDGPRLRQGWIDAASLVRDQDQYVYFGDLARIAMMVDGVVEVRNISLVAEGLDHSADALQRRGKDWVLRLRWPETREDLKDWHVTRRGARVRLAVGPLLDRLDDLRRDAGSRARTDGAAHLAGSPLTRPQGGFAPPEARDAPASPYLSLYRQLPQIYRRLFEAVLPPAEATHAAQFKAYVALLEQWMAHGIAQTRFVRELYTVSKRVKPSYAWQMLGDGQIPGLEALYAENVDKVGREVFASADAALERRNRVLDHLLALYGEVCAQTSIGPFGWYYGADAWRRHLFELKRQMLLRIVPLTRDRYGAVDYSRRSLGRRGNTSVLQQRVSLLLAFKYLHSRLLMPALHAAGLKLAGEKSSIAGTDKEPADSEPLALWGVGRQRVVDSLGDDLHHAARMCARLFLDLDIHALPPALLRCAVHAECYRHVPSETARHLWLGPDENERWWRLHLRSPHTSMEKAAICLHELACQLQLECEGMHLVEHVLLRPPAGSATAAFEQFDFHHRVTAIFPAWTARGHDPSFRQLAEETLALNAPAHLRVQTLWLDAPAMVRFEYNFERWLNARQALCSAWLQAEDKDPAATRRLEILERVLRGLLRQLLVEARGFREGTA